MGNGDELLENTHHAPSLPSVSVRLGINMLKRPALAHAEETCAVEHYEVAHREIRSCSLVGVDER